MEIKSKRILTKIFSISIFTLLLVGLSLQAEFRNDSSKSYAVGVDTSWYTELSELNENQPNFTSDLVYYRMSQFYQKNANGLYTSALNPQSIINFTSDFVILIENAADLQAFTELCNSDYRVDYLTYDYKLGNNIDFTDSARYDGFVLPVGWGTTEADGFSGTFDGNGFTISNLYYEPISSVNLDEYRDASGEVNIEYYSLFSQVARNGRIFNLGLINPVILQGSTYRPMIFVSPLVGINYGTVENVFVQDLRTDGGITADGGFDISGLMTSNAGIFRNAYVAYNMIISTSVNIVNYISPILNYNQIIIDGTYQYGTIENLYYNIELDSVYPDGLLNSYVRNNTTINFSEALERTEFTTVFDTTNYQSLWYDNNTYNLNVGLTYPILQGIRRLNNYFELWDAVDFVTMSHLMADYPIFSTYRYKLMDNIDLNETSSDAYVQSNTSFKGELTSEVVTDNAKRARFVNGLYSNYYTIRNVNINNGYSFNKYHGYGLFPFLEGNIHNINLYNANITIGDNLVADEITTVGLLAGKVERNARIENVNVYGTITNQTTLSNDGKFYFGGITGYTIGSIVSSTTAGILNPGQLVPNQQVSGSAIGGISGYLQSGNIQNTVNGMTITSFSFTTANTYDQYLGGIIGSGVTNEFYENVNKGQISVGSPTTPYTGIPYVAGIIGRHISSANAIYSLFNQGDINYYLNDLNTAYLSGVVNAVSPETKVLYEALNNASTITIDKNVTVTSATDATALHLYLSSVVFLYQAEADILGIANLDYKYTNNYNETSDGTYAYEKEALTVSQVIDLSIIDEYAPCLRTEETVLVNLENSYNYRNIDFITSGDIYFNNLSLSGNSTGLNVNYNGIRNEGNLIAHFTTNAPNTLQISSNVYKYLKVYGCFEEVNDGYFAKNIYNGGKIEVSVATDLTFRFCIYISGITHRNGNVSYITSNGRDKFNPESPTYDPNLKGTIDNAINNGEIYLHYDGLSGGIHGVTRVAGVVAYNASLITSCFNTGNIWNQNYIPAAGGAYGNEAYETESGGIVFMNIGQYALVRDCANSGDIVSVNTSNESRAGYSTNFTWVNAAGIVVRNDKLETGQDYSGRNFGHAQQIISFSINYGNIYSYNADNTNYNTWGGNEGQCKAGGILGQGLCTVINVLNYGNVYSSRISSGIYGQVFFSKYVSEMSASTVDHISISNSINYGKIRGLVQGIVPSYNSTAPNYGASITTYVRASDGNSIDARRNHVAGALIGNLYGQNRSELSKIQIRYLINFDDQVDILGCSVDVNVTGFATDNMATIKDDDWSPDPFGDIRSYTLDTSGTGVFNISFPLRTPLTSDDPDYFITDRFIADYIQFIPFSKVNDRILANLGWTNIAYSTAVNAFLNDLEAVATVIDSQLAENNIDSIFNYLMNNATLTTMLEDLNETTNLLWQVVDSTDPVQTAELLDLFLSITDGVYYTNANLQEDVLNAVYNILESGTIDATTLEAMFDKYFQATYFTNIVNNLTETELNELINYIISSMNLTDEEVDALFATYYPDGITNEERIQNILANAVDTKVLLDEIISNSTSNDVENSVLSLTDQQQNEIITTILNSMSSTDLTNLWAELSSNNQTLLTSILNANTVGGYLYYLANATSNVNRVDQKYGIVYNAAYNSATKPDGGGTFVYTGNYHYNEASGTYSTYSSNTSLTQILITYYSSTARQRYRITSTTEPVIFSYSRNIWYNYEIANSSTSGVYSSYTSTGNNNRVYTGIYLETHMRNTVNNIINSTSFVPSTEEVTSWLTNFLETATAAERSEIMTIFQSLLRYDNYENMITSNAFVDSINTALITNLLTTNTALIDNYFALDRNSKIRLSIDKAITDNSVFELLTSLRDKNNFDSMLEYIVYALMFSELTKEDYELFVQNGIFTSKDLIDLGLSYDSSLIEYYLRNGSFTLEQKRIIIYQLLLNSNSTINRNLIVNILNANIDDEETFVRLLTNAGINADDYLNYIGIYALSSSFGILNGNFIPDNINFTELDPVIGYDEFGEEITDTAWRGGFTEDGVADISDTSKVHYKFNVIMKQLKKAIATNVFDVELISENGEFSIPVSEINNTTGEEQLVFYVASNDEEINQTGYHINTVSGTFELSFGASFFNDGVKNEVLVSDDVLFTASDPVGSSKTGSIVVYAEDRTVATTYQVIIYKTSPKSVESLDAVYVNNSTTPSTVTTNGNTSTVVNNVNASNGSIRMEFSLGNVAYNISLAQKMVLTHESGATFDIPSLLDETVENNTIVTRPANVTDSVGPGDLIIALNIDSTMPGGEYTLTLNLNNTVYHNVIFTKARYTGAQVISASYNSEAIAITQSGTSYRGTTNINVGTPFTADDFVIVDGLPLYLTGLEISPLAVLSYPDGISPSYTVALNDNRYQYTITYNITSEDGNTVRTFVHTLIENGGNDTIENVFSDGVLIESNYTGGEYYYEFPFNTTPTLRFDQDLSNFYFDGTYGTLSIKNPDELVNAGILITINEQMGFEVRFNRDVTPGSYEFILVYESNIPLAIDGQPSTYEFPTITITKKANDDSLLDNIRFITDTVIATVDTLITGYQVEMNEFRAHRDGTTVIDSGIKCLLDGIYYNENDDFPTYYVIGLVSKTGLDQYKPTFTLPYEAKIYRTQTIGGVVYRYVTYQDSLNNGENLVYLVSEDGTTIREATALEDGTYPTTTIPSGYVVSDISGTVLDPALEADFNSTLSGDGTELLTYHNYRVYAEGYTFTNPTFTEDGIVKNYYTDYVIAVNDITNNIKFQLEVIAENEEVRDALKHIYVAIFNYENIEEGMTSSQGPLVNVMAMFTYQDLTSLTYLNEGEFSTNSSGWFIIQVTLPNGYTYIYQTDDGEENLPGEPYVPISSIVTRIVHLRITVKKISTSESWGVNSQFTLE